MAKLIQKTTPPKPDSHNPRRQFLKTVGRAGIGLGAIELARRLFIWDNARNEKGYRKWVAKIRKEKEELQNPPKNSALELKRRPIEAMQKKWLVERESLPNAPLAKPENSISQKTVNGTKYQVVGFNPNGIELVPLLPQDAFRLVASQELIENAQQRFGNRLIAVCNGAYFNPNNGRILGRLIADSKHVWWNTEQSKAVEHNRAIVFDRKRNPPIQFVEGKTATGETALTYLIQPIANGRIATNFSDRNIGQNKRNQWSAMVEFDRQKFAVIACNEKIFLTNFLKALQEMGAKNAVLLDSGSSIGLYYAKTPKGKNPEIIRAGSQTNMLAIAQRTK